MLGFFLVLLSPPQLSTPTDPPHPLLLWMYLGGLGLGFLVLVCGVGRGLVTVGWSFVFFSSIFGLGWGFWFQKLPTVMDNDFMLMEVAS